MFSSQKKSGMILKSVQEMFFMMIKVKNMICERCTIVVHHILTDLGLEAEYIKPGEVLLKEKISNNQLDQLNTELKKTGLELLFDHAGMIVQKIENIIFEMIHYASEPLMIKFSCYLSSRLNYSYTYLANMFKKVNGISIEQFIIIEKIEKVKTMLVHEGASLNEIAFILNYSSVSHPSAQFKKVTGIRAKDYKLRSMNSYCRAAHLIAV